MAGWTPPGAGHPSLVGEICPSCGQQLVDRGERVVEVEHAPRRGPWLAAGAVLVMAIAVVAVTGLGSEGEDVAAPVPTSTTAAAGDEPAPTGDTRADPAGEQGPPGVVWPADLPAALTSLTYAVGGASGERTWLVTLDRRSGQLLWPGQPSSTGPFGVIETDAGLALVDDSGLYLRGDDGVTRLRPVSLDDWPRPALAAEGVWELVGSPDALTTLVRTSLDDPADEVERVQLPVGGWIVGLWQGRPLLALETGAALGAYWVEPDGDLVRLTSGQPLVGGAGRLVEVICDDRFECQLQVVDLVTGAAVTVAPVAPGSVTAGAGSADGNAVVVWNGTDLRVRPMSINLADGTVRPFSDGATEAFGDLMRRAGSRPSEVSSVGLDPTGRYLLNAAATGVHVLDLETDADWTIGVEGGSEIVAAIGSTAG